MNAPNGWSATFLSAGSGSPIHTAQNLAGICPHCDKATIFALTNRHFEYRSLTAESRCYMLLQCSYQPCLKLTYVECTVKLSLFPLKGYDFFMHPYPGVDIIHPAIPSDIAADWREAQQAMSIGATKAAAMMARRVLYGVLLEQKFPEHPLNKVLKDFIQAKRLPHIFDDWTGAIRDDGADAAHPYRALQVDPEDIENTMEYTAELLRFVYIEPAEFKKRLERRAQP